MTISLVDAVDNSKVAAFEERQRRGFGRQQYYFEIYRADEVAVTSTHFSGGGWGWRLVDRERNVLAAAGGYLNLKACRQAVSNLGRFASSATLTNETTGLGVGFSPTIVALEPNSASSDAIGPTNPLLTSGRSDRTNAVETFSWSRKTSEMIGYHWEWYPWTMLNILGRKPSAAYASQGRQTHTRLIF